MAKKTIKKTPKIPNLLEEVKKYAKAGMILDTRHSKERQKERSISYAHIMHVLKNGWHESEKDEWKETYASWNYSIRGQTVDKIDLRIPVYFIEDKVTEATYFGIATVINLSKK